MNLRKCSSGSGNEKHLKLFAEKVKRQTSVKLLSKGIDENAAGFCITGRNEVVKSLNEYEREHLTNSVECTRIVRKKTLFSKTPGHTVGSVRAGKRRKMGATEKLVTFSTHSLPEEIVEEILSRLPVKSVARFRCVCKSWQHLTYSERFISLHVKNFRTSQLIVGTCFVLVNVCSIYFFPPPPPNGGYSNNDGASQMTERHDLPILFGGSCNGIVCLFSDCANGYIALWNPTTNETKKLRNSQSHIPESRNLCTVVFGFDPNTNDYKILQLVYGKHDTPAHMELYSLRKGSWKNVDSHDFSVVCGFRPSDVVCSLPFTDNRIVCAVVSPLSGTSEWEILSFDMSTEVYEVIPVSPTLDAELGNYRLKHRESFRVQKKWFKLFPYKETIAFGINHSTGVRRSYCDIWVLNGGFKSTAGGQPRSWSKILTTHVNVGNPLLVGCWGSSQILFQNRFSKKLLSLDHGTNKMVELVDIPYQGVTTSVYKESLVQIDDTNKTNKPNSIYQRENATIKSGLLSLPSIMQLQGNNSNNKPSVIFVIERAFLEVHKIKKKYQLLDGSKHADFLRCKGRNPADYRPEIVFSAIMAVLDHSLNKHGLLKALYVKTEDGRIIEINPRVNLPTNLDRLADLMMKLLQTKQITAIGTREKVLRMIRNPITGYLPVDSVKTGFSHGAAKRFNIQHYVSSINDEKPLVFVVSALAHREIEADYCDDTISIEEYPLSVSTCINKICEAVFQWRDS